MFRCTTFAVTVGPVAIKAVGASAAAISAATVIVAVGGAGALLLAGYGVYRRLSRPQVAVVNAYPGTFQRELFAHTDPSSEETS